MSRHKCQCECEAAKARAMSAAIRLRTLPVDKPKSLILDPRNWAQMEQLLQRFNDAEYAAHGGRRLDCGSGSCWIASMQSALRAFVR